MNKLYILVYSYYDDVEVIKYSYDIEVLLYVAKELNKIDVTNPYFVEELGDYIQGDDLHLCVHFAEDGAVKEITPFSLGKCPEYCDYLYDKDRTVIVIGNGETVKECLKDAKKKRIKFIKEKTK